MVSFSIYANYNYEDMIIVFNLIVTKIEVCDDGLRVVALAHPLALVKITVNTIHCVNLLNTYLKVI